QIWYPGYEAGHAVADVLFGDADPGGRLPTTMSHRIEDTPAFTNYPGEEGHVLYGEGIFVGYRWYDTRGIEPRYAFGYGLSYTTFGYEAARVSVDGDGVSLTVDVTNTGSRAGTEVVQVYVRRAGGAFVRPMQELKAFEKITLDPAETRRVSLRVLR